jgi:hypothetical protein
LSYMVLKMIPAGRSPTVRVHITTSSEIECFTPSTRT